MKTTFKSVPVGALIFALIFLVTLWVFQILMGTTKTLSFDSTCDTKDGLTQSSDLEGGGSAEGSRLQRGRWKCGLGTSFSRDSEDPTLLEEEFDDLEVWIEKQGQVSGLTSARSKKNQSAVN